LKAPAVALGVREDPVADQADPAVQAVQAAREDPGDPEVLAAGHHGVAPAGAETAEDSPDNMSTIKAAGCCPPPY